MLKASLCDYSDAYILVKETTTVVGQRANDAAIAADRNNNEVIFKNSTSFSKQISKINNADIDNAEDLDIVMPMYNLLEYSNHYSKASASLW